MPRSTARSLGLEVSALRYFNVYGPRQRPDTQYAAAVPIFIRQLLAGKAPTVFGDGTQTRDLIFVGDVVRANLMAAEHPAAPGQVFNVCTGRPDPHPGSARRPLANCCRRAAPDLRREPTGRHRCVRRQSANECRRFWVSRHETSLLEGLKETVEWMH